MLDGRRLGPADVLNDRFGIFLARVPDGGKVVLGLAKALIALAVIGRGAGHALAELYQPSSFRLWLPRIRQSSGESSYGLFHRAKSAFWYCPVLFHKMLLLRGPTTRRA